jgi:hypothetical protein
MFVVKCMPVGGKDCLTLSHINSFHVASIRAATTRLPSCSYFRYNAYVISKYDVYVN